MAIKRTLRHSNKANKFNFSKEDIGRVSEFDVRDEKGFFKRTITPISRQIGLSDSSWPDADLQIYGVTIPEGGLRLPGIDTDQAYISFGSTLGDEGIGIRGTVLQGVETLQFRETADSDWTDFGTGDGTVTSVGFDEGSMINITGDNPITVSGNITITTNLSDAPVENVSSNIDTFVVVTTDGNGSQINSGNIDISLFNNDAFYGNGNISVGDNVSLLNIDIPIGNANLGDDVSEFNIDIPIGNANLPITSGDIDFPVGNANLPIGSGDIDFPVGNANIGDNVSLFNNDADYIAEGDDVSLLNNDAGYGTGNGDVTSVGVTSNGEAEDIVTITNSPITTSGDINLELDLNGLSTSTSDSHGDWFVVVGDGGMNWRLNKQNIKLSGFDNDQPFGEIISISNGTGLDITGTATVPIIGISANGVDKDQIADDAVDTDQIADDAVEQAQIAENAVGVTEMANLTAAHFILGDASGNPAVETFGGDMTIDAGGDCTIVPGPFVPTMECYGPAVDQPIYEAGLGGFNFIIPADSVNLINGSTFILVKTDEASNYSQNAPQWGPDPSAPAASGDVFQFREAGKYEFNITVEIKRATADSGNAVTFTAGMVSNFNNTQLGGDPAGSGTPGPPAPDGSIGYESIWEAVFVFPAVGGTDAKSSAGAVILEMDSLFVLDGPRDPDDAINNPYFQNNLFGFFIRHDTGNVAVDYNAAGTSAAFIGTVGLSVIVTKVG